MYTINVMFNKSSVNDGISWNRMFKQLLYITGNKFYAWKQTGWFNDATTNLQFVQGKKQVYRKARMI